MCRCPICDTVEGPFVKDPFTKDFVCLECANIIQDTSGSDWAEVELEGEFDEFSEMD